MQKASGREPVKRPKPPAAPKLPRTTPERELEPLEDGERFAQALLRGGKWAQLKVRSLTFDACRVHQLDLSGAELPRWTAVDCEFQACNLANLEGEDSSLLRVTLNQCKCSGARIHQATWRDVDLVDCKGDYASFQGLKARQVRLRGCDLRQVEFYECQFDSVIFHECDLSQASFSNCRFELSEFKGCDLTGLRGLANLRGARMNAADLMTIAIPLARELGIGLISETDP